MPGTGCRAGATVGWGSLPISVATNDPTTCGALRLTSGERSSDWRTPVTTISPSVLSACGAGSCAAGGGAACATAGIETNTAVADTAPNKVLRITLSLFDAFRALVTNSDLGAILRR